MRATAWIAWGLLSVAACGAAEAAQVRERTTYFAVRGSTLAELDADLSRAGPLVAETGIRHPGATEVRFDGRVSYRDVARGCEVAATELSLDLTMMLPRWNPPRGVEAETVLVWRTLEEDIRRHEAEHATIAKLWLKKMESAIRNLRPERDCATMEARVNQVSARYLGEHERAQTEFDSIEGREVNVRLRRALIRTIRDYGAR